MLGSIKEGDVITLRRERGGKGFLWEVVSVEDKQVRCKGVYNGRKILLEKRCLKNWQTIALKWKNAPIAPELKNTTGII